MRSSTTFLVFGGLVAVLVIYSLITQKQQTQSPPVQAATAFLAALKTNDAAAVTALTDAKTTRVVAAGNHIISLRFSKIAPFPGAFIEKPQAVWSYAELTRLTLDSVSTPVLITNEKTKEAVATLALNSGYKAYLHTVNGTWTIFYLDRAEEKAQ